MDETQEFDELGQDYEKWLDEIEANLPVITEEVSDEF